jgi:Tol biopolymer transport system component
MAPAPATPAPPPAAEDPATTRQQATLVGEIGFVSDGHLRVVDVASGKVRDLVSSGAVQGFDWSPDGSEVAIATSGYPPVIKRMPVDGGEGEAVGQAGLGGTDPRWSPSGDALAFVVYDSDVGSSVHLVSLIGESSAQNAAESEASPLAPEAPTFRVGTNPVWSPDGRWLAYEREGAIRVLTADGSREAQVSLGVTRCALGSWSPDAQRVGYSGLDRAATGTSIFASSASDGARGQSVTRGGGDDVLPAWSPDGLTIAFLRPIPAHEAAAPESTPGESEAGSEGAVPSPESEEDATSPPMALWVVDVGSGRERQISEEPVLLVQPHWSPDGGWLAYIAPGSSETTQRLMVCSLDGDVVRQLAEAPAIRGMSWRPKTGDGAEE